MSPMHSLPPNATADQIKNILNRMFTVLTTIVVDTGNVIIDPDDIQSLRAGPAVWLVYNNDTTAHTVGIDPASFKIKATGVYENPLAEKRPLSSGTVASKSVGIINAHIKGDAEFTKYKYTITSDGQPLDPDLDVVDP